MSPTRQGAQRHRQAEGEQGPWAVRHVDWQIDRNRDAEYAAVDSAARGAESCVNVPFPDGVDEQAESEGDGSRSAQR